MGIRPRRRQRFLHTKLFRIRKYFDLSQPQLLKRLKLSQDFSATNISAYERGHLEPPYYVLLRYAELAGVCTDVLIDDRRKLPAELPGLPEHRGHGHEDTS
ncbi:MAG TPA: hypothetical protein VJ302_24190 [Blastocatellia bacterium]|nr:hypothetical protein [Blastocatellia bacterium]